MFSLSSCYNQQGFSPTSSGVGGRSSSLAESDISETEYFSVDRPYSPLDSHSLEDEHSEPESPNLFFSTLLRDRRRLCDVDYENSCANMDSEYLSPNQTLPCEDTAGPTSAQLGKDEQHGATESGPSENKINLDQSSDESDCSAQSLQRVGLKRLLYLSSRVRTVPSGGSERNRLVKEQIGPYVRSFKLSKSRPKIERPALQQENTSSRTGLRRISLYECVIDFESSNTSS